MPGPRRYGRAAKGPAPRPAPKPRRVPVSPDHNGPHAGTGAKQGPLLTTPTYSTGHSPGWRQRFKKTQAQVRAAHARAAVAHAKSLGFSQGGNLIAHTASDLATAAKEAPGGVVQAAKGAALDRYDVVRGRYHHSLGGALYAALVGKRTGHMLEEMGRSTAHDLRHPLRHPGYTLLDALAIGSAGAGAASRIGAASRALAEGEGVSGALARSGARGGSLLHKPEPGTAEIAPGVHKLLSRNALRRHFQARRVAGIRQAVSEGRESGYAGGGRLGRKIADETAAQSTVGRELRAQRRIETSLANANSGELRHALRGLSKDEHSAIGVVGIEGKAALERPAETIARHVKTQERFVRDLQNEVMDLNAKLTPKAAARSRRLRELHAAIEANREHIANLEGAGKALENPSPKLRNALETAHRVANETELESVKRGLITSEQAVARRAKVASIYRRSGLKKPAPSQDVAFLEKRLDRLDSEIKLSDLRRKRAGTDAARIAHERLIAEADRVRRQVADAQGTKYGSDLVSGKAPEGSFYFPLSKAYTERFRRAAPERGYTPQMQATGLAKPTPGRYVPGHGHEFTGRSVKLGGVTPQVGEHIADVAARRNRLFSAQDFHKRLLGYATDAKEHAEQVPLRETSGVSDELKRVLAKAEERAHIEPGEAPHLHEKELADVQGSLTHEHVVLNGREVAPGDVPIGTKIAGVKWVDRRYVKDMDTLAPRSEIGRAIDEYVNRPVRFASIYARPSYALNWLGNYTMLAITEGASLPRVMLDARRVEETLGPELTSKIDAGVGTSRTASYLSRRSRAGKLTHDVQEWWQRVTDQGARRAAFFGEARRAGFTDAAGWRKLLSSDDPEIAAKRVEVFRRARRNIVDFDSMTPAEQQLATYVFVYPWVSRGSAWAVHATLEHPLKTATLANLGEATHKQMLGGLDLPSWLDGAIPIHVGGQTYLMNPSGVNTYATAAEVGESLVGAAKGAGGLKSGDANLADLLSPAAELGLAAAGGESGSKTGLLGLLSNLPEVQALIRSGVVGKPPKTYPDTGVYPALTPLLGGAAPRKADTAYLEQQAAKDQRATMTPVERAKYDVAQEARSVIVALRKQHPGLVKRAKPRIAHVYALKSQVDVARAKARAETDSPDEYQRKALEAEIDVLASWGVMSKERATRAKANVEHASIGDVKKARRWLVDHEFAAKYLDAIRELKKYLGVA